MIDPDRSYSTVTISQSTGNSEDTRRVVETRRATRSEQPTKQQTQGRRRLPVRLYALGVLMLFAVGTVLLTIRSLSSAVERPFAATERDDVTATISRDEAVTGVSSMPRTKSAVTLVEPADVESAEDTRSAERKRAALTVAVGEDEEAGTYEGPEIDASAKVLHVAAKADLTGDGSRERPFKSAAEAIAAAQPGDVVLIGPGTYNERLRSARSGAADAPIRIVGEDGARIRSDGRDHLIRITHDHIWVENLELTDAKTLVWVENATGVRLLHNDLSNAGGECIRLKYFSRRNEVAYNTIQKCGRSGFDLDTEAKNGEAIYIGTAPEQVDEKNPTDDPDRSDRNWVHHNEILARAECVDIKEAATDNRVEDNICRDGADPKGGGFSSRGRGTVFARNTSEGHAGSGIQLAGDDSDEDAVESVVVGNILRNNRGFGLRVANRSHTLLCGNVFDGNKDGAMSPLAGGADEKCPKN